MERNGKKEEAEKIEQGRKNPETGNDLNRYI
jgi:hypothetical protein